MTTFAVPGQVLGTLSSHTPGVGTHVVDNSIYASLLGSINITPASTKSTKSSISILRPQAGVSGSSSSGSTNELPKVGSKVLLRILRVQRLSASCSILSTLSPSETPQQPVITQYSSMTNDDLQPQAILRKEDVRAYEKDRVVMNESFRVGDIVKAVVISLGDERNYYVSTAGDEYGVVIARSEAGHPMTALSWREMRDVVTGRSETRKVAKPT